jgi:hypothetical protein
MQIVICNSFGNVTTSVFVFLFFSCRHQPLRYVVVMVDPHIMLCHTRTKNTGTSSCIFTFMLSKIAPNVLYLCCHKQPNLHLFTLLKHTKFL